MSITGKFLLVGILLASVLGGLSTGLATIVTYAPYGVSKAERADYEKKVSLIKREEALRQEAQSMGLPQAVLPSTRYDFGLVDPHTTASHAFEIWNHGAGPLTIDVAETTCKCTVGSAQKGTLAPGEKTSVTLTWNTGQKSEQYEQAARVITNDPTREVIDLTVTGVVKTELFVPAKGVFHSGDAGEVVESTLLIYSQQHDDIAVVSAESDLVGFDWESSVVPSDSQPSLSEQKPTVINQVRLRCRAQKPGRFQGEVKLHLLVNGESDVIEKSVELTGRVHAPISFHSPMLHSRDGLELGTLGNDQEHEFHLIVRKHFSEERALSVLDVSPKSLDVSIEPTSRSGDYRLTIRIPKGIPSTIFNLDQKRGYIQIGDPENEDFSNWFPLIGAVVANDE
ncbi:DUF1573 domain-containing protein [Rhodopirellula europaea]|uniref:Signal peptide protein n=1 Tax=Rhodopirellula europaea 6C TaxID=1263867 RepID=M2B2Z6_9BACT|nr:DUF1573 domain-containing protein [Rhodopirellula europaea]EMB16143.1 signal peptide protein [Rhodopirellula europaea 6C]